MNKLINTLAVITLSVSAMGVANASQQLVGTDDSVTTNICLSAASGKKIELLKAIKDSGLSKRYVAENVQCNNMDIVQFVEKYGANPVATNDYITRGEYSRDLDISTLAAR